MTVVTAHTKKAQPDKLISEQFLAAELDEVENLLKEGEKIPFETKIVWRNVILFAALHLGAAIGFYQLLFVAKWPTVF
ncbi:hypothetical protein ANCDUO_20401, partial [Ancylostoma duodenale]